MAMAIVFPSRNEPLGELNTTPLIDVMLVILVVLILAVPAGTHSLDYDLPRVKPPLNVVLHEDRNRLSITANDAVLWNGTRVDGPALVTILARANALKPEPQLEFAPEAEASYELSAQVLQIVKASGATNFGFVGNERYRDFARAP
jgi:biopolymer transport protein ExbD